MAITRLTGFESGSSGELQINGTASFVTSGQRTGSYALRCNPTTTGTGYCRIYSISATGVIVGTPAAFADGSVIGFAFKAATLPAASEERIASGYPVSLATSAWVLKITSGGLLKLYGTGGTTLITTGATVIGATYVYIEVRVNSATDAYEVRINGTAEFSGTDAALTAVPEAFFLGKPFNDNGQTVDFYYDDVYVDEAGTFQATTTATPEVRILLPNAAGDGTGWTNGTGTQTFAEVDEVPPESDGTDLTYLQAAATEDNTYRTSNVESTATKGVTGTILAVDGYVWAKTGSVSGTSTVGIRVRSNTTNSDGTGFELTTTYQGIHRTLATDPNGGGAWTSGGVDGVQIGMFAGTIAQTQRFSASYVFVLALVTAASGALTLQAIGGASSVSNLLVTSPAKLTPGAVAGTSSVSNLLVTSPAIMALQAVAGVAAVSNLLVTSPAKLTLDAIAGVAVVSNLAVTTPAGALTLQQVNGSASVSNLLVSSPAKLTLQSVDGIAAVSNLLVTSPAKLTLQSVDGVAAVSNLLVSSPVRIALDPVAGVAVVSNLAISTPAPLVLQAVVGVAVVSNLVVSGPASIQLDPIAGVAVVSNLVVDTPAPPSGTGAKPTTLLRLGR